MATWIRGSALMVTLVGASITLAQAQDEGPPSQPPSRYQRSGFFIGFGFGAGNEAFNIKDDAAGWSSSEYAPTFYLKLGGTANPGLIIGAEVFGWSDTDGFRNRNVGSLLVFGQWYPKATGPLYLKGGGGIANAGGNTSGSGNQDQTGFAFSVGAGYELRVGRTTSFIPSLDIYYYDYSGFSSRVINVGFGVMFH